MRLAEAECRRCDGRIRWVESRYGGKVPLEISPDSRGEWQVIDGVAYKLIGAELEAAREHGELLFSHHSGENCRVTKGVPCPPHLRVQLGLPPLAQRLEEAASSE